MDLENKEMQGCALEEPEVENGKETLDNLIGWAEYDGDQWLVESSNKSEFIRYVLANDMKQEAIRRLLLSVQEQDAQKTKEALQSCIVALQAGFSCGSIRFGELTDEEMEMEAVSFIDDVMKNI